jgi:hypothetical protein
MPRLQLHEETNDLQEPFARENQHPCKARMLDFSSDLSTAAFGYEWRTKLGDAILVGEGNREAPEHSS